MFARIDTYIPVYPARAEHTAPTKKLKTVLPATACVRGEKLYPAKTTTAKTSAQQEGEAGQRRFPTDGLDITESQDELLSNRLRHSALEVMIHRRAVNRTALASGER